MTTSDDSPVTLDLVARMAKVRPRDPNETDAQWEERSVRELFGGLDLHCRDCGAPVQHLGVCDDCIARWEQQEGRVDLPTWLNEHGVPRAMARCTWGTWRETNNSKLERQLAILRKWRGDPALVVLAGPPGVGKTHCAVATMVRWFNAGKRSQVLLTEAELVLRVKEGFNANTDSDVLRRMQRCHLFVLDDLGRAMTSDWGTSMVVNNLIHRIDNGSPTLVTTNLTHGEVVERLDERLASRMWQGLAVSYKATHDFRKGGKRAG
jgi:chromosomal replication initiation ATPase DnaA